MHANRTGERVRADLAVFGSVGYPGRTTRAPCPRYPTPTTQEKNAKEPRCIISSEITSCYHPGSEGTRSAAGGRAGSAPRIPGGVVDSPMRATGPACATWPHAEEDCRSGGDSLSKRPLSLLSARLTKLRLGTTSTAAEEQVRRRDSAIGPAAAVRQAEEGRAAPNAPAGRRRAREEEEEEHLSAAIAPTRIAGLQRRARRAAPRRLPAHVSRPARLVREPHGLRSSERRQPHDGRGRRRRRAVLAPGARSISPLLRPPPLAV